MSQKLYPLRFKEILRSYGFGNRWLVDAFNKTGLPEDHSICETWEVCDREEGVSEVINGNFTGVTLHDLIDIFGEEFLGSEIVAKTGLRFPLLIKFLDVTYKLGEQVHENDELAKELGIDDPGKTEAWYFVKTKPGAKITVGNRSGMTRKDLEEALIRGESREIMVPQDIKPGDAFLLHAGTMHYGEDGFIFYEIMQNSNVCISLRPERLGANEEERKISVKKILPAIHIEDNFDARTVPVTIKENGIDRTITMACNYFALDRLDFSQNTSIQCNGDKFYVLTLLEGELKVKSEHGEVTLLSGMTCLLAASLGEVSLEPSGQVSVLKAYVPNLQKDIIEPLRAQGISDPDIEALGARTTLNHLTALLH